MQSKVGTHNTHVVRHNLIHLLHRLCYQHLLLVGHRTLVIPLRHLFIIVIQINMCQRVLRSSIGIDNRFNERVRSQSVTAMQTCAGTLTEGIKALDAALSVDIHLDATAHIVGSGSDGNIVGGDINADREAFLIDIGEVATGFFGIFVRDVETHVVETMNLHFLIDCTGHNVTRCQ